MAHGHDTESQDRVSIPVQPQNKTRSCVRRFQTAHVRSTGSIRPGSLLRLSTRHPHGKLAIERFLLFLGRLHSQCIFHLRRSPQPDSSPGHDADAEQGACFGGEVSVGARNRMSDRTFSLDFKDIYWMNAYLHNDIGTSLHGRSAGEEVWFYSRDWVGCHVAR